MKSITVPSVLFLALCASDTASAFTLGVTAPSAAMSHLERKTTALNLVPSQGCQLAAASIASLSKKEEGDDAVSEASITNAAGRKTTPAVDATVTPTNAGRAFLDRIFSLPSQIMGQRNRNHVPIKLPFSFDSKDNDSDDEADALLYPIVGFQFVKIKSEDPSLKTKCQALPTTNCKTYCNLAIRQGSQLPLYGWYSPACHLGNIFMDDEEYCGMPSVKGQVHPSEM